MKTNKVIKLGIQISRLQDTPNGIWNGGYIFHCTAVGGDTDAYRGCPMGRGYSEETSIEDFIRRAKLDGAPETLRQMDCTIVARRGMEVA